MIRPAGACAIILMLAGCGDKKAPEPTAPVLPPGAVAQVAGDWILESDVRAEAERLRAAGRPVPPASELVTRMVNRRAMLHHAHTEGFADRPEVKHAIENLVIGKLRDHASQQTEDPVVSEELVQQHYQDNIERYTQPARTRLAILKLKGGQLISEAKRDELSSKMESTRAQALTDAPTGLVPGFGILARENSDDVATRHRGGDAGWFTSSQSTGRWPTPVLETGFQLADGEISPVLEVEGNWYLVKRTDSRPATVTAIEKVRSSIVARIKRERAAQAEQNFYAGMQAHSNTRFIQKNISSIKLEPSYQLAASPKGFQPPALQGSSK